MIRRLYLCLIALFSFNTFANTSIDLISITPPKTFENIHVQPLGTSETASEYLIFIKHGVKAHMHQTHTELVYVIEGEGVFRLDDTKQIIKSGDFIRINKGVIHSVIVTSETPLKVLSIQTPKFEGKDRVFIDKQP